MKFLGTILGRAPEIARMPLITGLCLVAVEVIAYAGFVLFAFHLSKQPRVEAEGIAWLFADSYIYIFLLVPWLGPASLALAPFMPFLLGIVEGFIAQFVGEALRTEGDRTIGYLACGSILLAGSLAAWAVPFETRGQGLFRLALIGPRFALALLLTPLAQKWIFR